MYASHNNVTTLLPPTQLSLNGATFLLTYIDILWPLVLEFKEKHRPFLRALKAFLLVAFHPLLLHSQDPAFTEMHHKVVGSLVLLLTVRLSVFIVVEQISPWSPFMLLFRVVLAQLWAGQWKCCDTRISTCWLHAQINVSPCGTLRNATKHLKFWNRCHIWSAMLRCMHIAYGCYRFGNYCYDLTCYWHNKVLQSFIYHCRMC